MRILLLRSWLTNIGNGFIDRGAEEIVRQAFPESEIISISGYGKQIQWRQRASSVLPYIGQSGEQFFDISSVTEPDVAVLPGCTLYDTFLEKYEKTLSELNDRNIPIILLGTGSGDYSTSAQNYVKSFFEDIQISGFISRNTKAYDLYSDYFVNSHNGLDCAYFIDDWYSPPELNSELMVKTFDILNEPETLLQETDYETTVRPHHSPFDNPFIGLSKRAIQKYSPYDVAGKNYGSKLDKKNPFISDSLEDYLLLYMNAKEVHADRIHACIPGLVYGAEVRFYYETARKGVFKDLVDGDIENELVQIDDERLSREKEIQVSKFSQMVDDAI
jgi:hypothetical protein